MNTLNWRYISVIWIGLPLALVFAPGMKNAQADPVQLDTEFAAVDAYITTQMDTLNVPGMALGVIEDGEIAHLQGYGVADSSGRVVVQLRHRHGYFPLAHRHANSRLPH